jgi:hypothetical protein
LIGNLHECPAGSRQGRPSLPVSPAPGEALPPFFLTQFLGAFNDNLFKNALVVLLTFQAASWTTIAPALLANLAAGIFILPFFLFSATAGQLADKYDKARLTRLVKVLEMASWSSRWPASSSTAWRCCWGRCSCSAAIRPCSGRSSTRCCPSICAKTSWWAAMRWWRPAPSWRSCSARWRRPARRRRTRRPVDRRWPGGGVCRLPHQPGVPPAPAPEPGLINPNPLTETWRNIGFARENRPVFLAILGISWFWLYGALFLAQFPAYAKGVLGGGEGTVTLLLATFTVGIGLGSLLCEKLSGGHIEIGLVPFGSIGLTLFGLDLALASPAPAGRRTAGHRRGAGAARQSARAAGAADARGVRRLLHRAALRDDAEPLGAGHRARVIAANNILNALFMVGALGAAAARRRAVDPMLFGVAAVMNAAVAVYIYRLVPEFLLRFIVWLLVHTVYRLRTEGLEHIPAEGPAVMVCNHVSFVDALVIAAASAGRSAS